MIDVNEVRKEAQRQLDKERFDKLVADEVARLKAYRPWRRKVREFVWRLSKCN